MRVPRVAGPQLLTAQEIQQVVARFVYRFAWDPAKATANRRKHGVSFELGAAVFRDRSP